MKNVQRSACVFADKEHTKRQSFRKLEVVVTLFRVDEDEVPYIVAEAGESEIVLQQGVTGEVKPLSKDELKKIGDEAGRRVKIGDTRRR